ncbi:MAG: hypothetical protein ABIT01_15085 [Thermoanaerobaculia bacterium]
MTSIIAALVAAFPLAGQTAVQVGPTPTSATHDHGTKEDMSSDTSESDPMASMEKMPAMDHWMTMFHGYAFLTMNRQGGPSGERDFESQNHLMVTATRAVGGGKLSFLGTFTAEPATVPLAGSSELFQRGETYRGALPQRRRAHRRSDDPVCHPGRLVVPRRAIPG